MRPSNWKPSFSWSRADASLKLKTVIGGLLVAQLPEVVAQDQRNGLRGIPAAPVLAADGDAITEGARARIAVMRGQIADELA